MPRSDAKQRYAQVHAEWTSGVRTELWDELWSRIFCSVIEKPASESRVTADENKEVDDDGSWTCRPSSSHRCGGTAIH